MKALRVATDYARVSRVAMHRNSVDQFRHEHDHGGPIRQHEARMRWVVEITAAMMVAESSRRLGRPLPIGFGEALPVAVLGLIVNLLSAKLLDAGHSHDHAHEPHDHHHDHILRAAYAHVLADALTSVLAILALLGG